MKTLFAATAAVAALFLTGCWSDGPFGSSGTCASNNHHISYITWWPSQLYTPVIFNTYLTVNLGGPYQETDPARQLAELRRAVDFWGHSYNTCGIPDDDTGGAIPLDGHADTDRSVLGFPTHDGVSRIDDGDLDHICGGCRAITAYTAVRDAGNGWGSFTDVDIRLQRWHYWTYAEIRQVGLHEVGHAMGLCHNGGCGNNYINDGNLMGYPDGHDQLGRGDVSGLHSLYGAHGH